MIINAIEHGNLEIDYETKKQMLDEFLDYPEFLRDRARKLPYSERKSGLATITCGIESSLILKMKVMVLILAKRIRKSATRRPCLVAVYLLRRLTWILFFTMIQETVLASKKTYTKLNYSLKTIFISSPLVFKK